MFSDFPRLSLATTALEAISRETTNEISHIAKERSSRRRCLTPRKGMPDIWNLVPEPRFEPSARHEAQVVTARHQRSASCLIMFACALCEESRDDELIVSLDHCSRWEAPLPFVDG